MKENKLESWGRAQRETARWLIWMCTPD